MVTWTRADVVILTALELEYAAVKRVEAGAALGSRWIEEKHNGLLVLKQAVLGLKIANDRLTGSRTHEGRVRVVPTRPPAVC